MSAKYVLQGWRLSYYTAKLHSYLSYKQIPFQFHLMNVVDIQYLAPKRVGASVMPILYNNETKKYSQDTHDIIMALERSYPNQPVIPMKINPKQYFLNFLLAAWFDECWVPTAMHYRWMFPESVNFFKHEARQGLFGKTLHKFIPPFLSAPVVDRVANRLMSYLPGVGVRKEQAALIESWTASTLHLLNNHFAEYDYLLGTEHPTLADFALCGPLLAHLYRDPYPKAHVIGNFPHVQQYADRMLSIAPGWEEGKSRQDKSVPSSSIRVSDDVPSTLLPIIQQIFFEYVPLVEATQVEILKLQNNPKFSLSGQGRSLPRALGEIAMPMKHQPTIDGLKRSALPFNVWKFQQASQAFHELDGEVQKSILTWLQEHHITNTAILQDNNYQTFPKLKRTALSVKFT